MSSQDVKTEEGQRARNGKPAPAARKERDPYYILAKSPPADVHNRVLKHGDTFAVFDRFGDVRPTGLEEEGIYHQGTRFLSCLLLGLQDDRPLFLSSTVKAENDLLAVDLANADLDEGGRVVVPRGTLHLARLKFILHGACYECLRIKNFGLAPVRARLTLHFEADFADIFEVRGTKRKRKGHFGDPQVTDGSVVLPYEGLDGVPRRTRLLFEPTPAELTESDAHFDLTIPPRDEVRLHLTVSCEIGAATAEARPLPSFDAALAANEHAFRHAEEGEGVVRTANERFNAWLERATADLNILTTQTAYGPYPYAGVPWFSTPFGRDGLITALECLWLNPGLARGVLAFLAATQDTEVNPAQDAEPGKILHEARGGEMAALGEIPFGRYYGSIDATPLFVLLAGAYYERTGDRAFIESLWPHLEAALHWIDDYGDRDGDGFVEYQRQTSQGLEQQGWKDSQDAVFHADGALARAPIALCEVQGYVYAAKRAAAELAVLLGHLPRADALRAQADALQKHFEQAFWCEELSTYALALDDDKRPCRVRTSNAGQCLMTGIASPEHARRVARTLLDGNSFSGWGVRTVADTEARFNPMSYHNGSVWPHDNALIALGLARYGLKEEVLPILTGLFETSYFMDLHRLPELFCGFGRRAGRGPTLYPVACAPQAWASAAVFLLLQACLGLGIKGAEGRILFDNPLLPPALREVRIRNLRVGTAVVDLLLERHGKEMGVNVLRREGGVTITTVQ
jgi:glycogen debranching enzyme